MKTAREIWGKGWADVDVLMIATPTQRRPYAETHAERLTFGMACNALILSLRRVDTVDRRHYASGRQRFGVLRPGMFTLRDMAAAFIAWRAGERFVMGFGPACETLMAQFFGIDADMANTDAPARAWNAVRDIFITILDMAEAEKCELATYPRGRPRQVSPVLENIVALAHSGIQITEHKYDTITPGYDRV